MTYELVSSVPAINFCNTVAEWTKAAKSAIPKGDLLVTYQDLLLWSEQAGLISRNVRKTLEAESNSRQAQLILEQAKNLRQAAYTLFHSSKAALSAELQTINDICSSAPHKELTVRSGSLKMTWPKSAESELAFPVWLIAEDTQQLLADEAQRQKIKICPATDCGWVFLDTSKNQSRCWCSMRDCGNRSKAQRYYERHRAS